MIVKEKKIILKNNKECILRTVKIEDASAMIDFITCVADETPYLMNYSEEIQFTIEQEEAFIQSFIDSPTNAMVIAEVDGDIAGNSNISVVANKLKTKHRCNFGIAIYKKYWGLGIGRALISFMIELAKNYGYQQMELEACKNNVRAIALYTKAGFKKVGSIPNAFLYKDGTYDDEVKMVNFLGDLGE